MAWKVIFRGNLPVPPLLEGRKERQKRQRLFLPHLSREAFSSMTLGEVKLHQTLEEHSCPVGNQSRQHITKDYP